MREVPLYKLCNTSGRHSAMQRSNQVSGLRHVGAWGFRFGRYPRHHQDNRLQALNVDDRHHHRNILFERFNQASILRHAGAWGPGLEGTPGTAGGRVGDD